MDDSLIIEETKRVFQSYYKEPLSDADALGIHNNLVGFLKLLLKMDKKINDKKESEERR